MPLLINMLVYTVVVWFVFSRFSNWLDNFSIFSSWQDVWIIGALSGVIKFVLGAGLLLVSLYTFTLLANLIGSPFNSLLAEQVEARLRGHAPPPTGWVTVLKSVPVAILSELRKWLYVAIWLIPIGITYLIPIIQMAAPFLLLLFGAWVFALEYLDYPIGNHGHGFKQVRQTARRHRMSALGFGSAVAIMTAIPIVSLFVMPVAVAGATAWFVEQDERPRPQPDKSA